MIEQATWFYEEKLLGIFVALANLANYEINETEFDEIKHKLLGTNDEKNQWADYTLNGKTHKIILQLAHDDADHQIIHIKVKAPKTLKTPLKDLLDF